MEDFELENENDDIQYMQSGGAFNDINEYNRLAATNNTDPIIATNEPLTVNPVITPTMEEMAQPFVNNNLREIYTQELKVQQFQQVPQFEQHAPIKTDLLIALEKATGMSKADYIASRLLSKGGTPRIPTNLPIQPYTMQSFEEYKAMPKFKDNPIFKGADGKFDETKAKQYYDKAQTQLKEAYQNQQLAASLFPDSKFVTGTYNTGFNIRTYQNVDKNNNASKFEVGKSLYHNLYYHEGFKHHTDENVLFKPNASKRGKSESVDGKTVIYYDPESWDDYAKYSSGGLALGEYWGGAVDTDKKVKDVNYGQGVIIDKDKTGRPFLRLAKKYEDVGDRLIGNVYGIKQQKTVHGIIDTGIGIIDAGIAGLFSTVGATVKMVNDFDTWVTAQQYRFGMHSNGVPIHKMIHPISLYTIFNPRNESNAKVNEAVNIIANSNDADKIRQAWLVLDDPSRKVFTNLEKSISKYQWKKTETDIANSGSWAGNVAYYGEGTANMMGQVAGILLTSRNPASIGKAVTSSLGNVAGRSAQMASLLARNSTPFHIAKNLATTTSARIGLQEFGHNMMMSIPAINKAYTQAVITGSRIAPTLGMMKFATLTAEEVQNDFIRHGLDISTSSYMPLIYGLSYLFNKAGDYVVGGKTSQSVIKYLTTKSGLVNMAGLYQQAVKEETKNLTAGIVKMANGNEALKEQLVKGVVEKSVNKTLLNLHTRLSVNSGVEAITEWADEGIGSGVANIMAYFQDKNNKLEKAIPADLLKMKWQEMTDAGIFTFAGSFLLGKMGMRGKFNKPTGNENPLMSIITDDSQYKGFVTTLQREASGEGIGLFYAKGLKINQNNEVVVVGANEKDFNSQLSESLLTQVTKLRELYKADIKVQTQKLKEQALANFKKTGKYGITNKDGETIMLTPDDIKEQIADDLVNGNIDTFIKHIANKDFYDRMLKVDKWDVDELGLQEQLGLLTGNEQTGTKAGVEKKLDKKDAEAHAMKLQNDFLDYYIYTTSTNTDKNLNDYIKFKTDVKRLQDIHFNKVTNRLNSIINTERELTTNTPEDLQRQSTYINNFKNGKVKYYTQAGKSVVEQEVQRLQQEINDKETTLNKELSAGIMADIVDDNYFSGNYDDAINNVESEREDLGDDIADNYIQYLTYLKNLEEQINKTKESQQELVDKLDVNNALNPKFLKDEKDIEKSLHDLDVLDFFPKDINGVLDDYLDNETSMKTVGLSEYNELMKELAPEYAAKANLMNSLIEVADKYNAYRKFTTAVKGDIKPEDLYLELATNVKNEDGIYERKLTDTGEAIINYLEDFDIKRAALLKAALSNDSAFQRNTLQITSDLFNTRANSLLKLVSVLDSALTGDITSFVNDIATHNTLITNVKLKENGSIDPSELQVIRNNEEKLFKQLQDIQEAVYSSTFDIASLANLDTMSIADVSYISNIKNNNSKQVIIDLKSKVDIKLGIAPSVEQILAIEQLVLFTRNTKYKEDLTKYKESKKNNPAYTDIATQIDNIDKSYYDLIQTLALKVNGANGTGKSKLFTWFSQIMTDGVFYTAPYPEQIENLRKILDKNAKIIEVEENSNISNIATLIKKIKAGDIPSGSTVVVDEHTLIAERFTDNKGTKQNEGESLSELLSITNSKNIKVILIGDEYQSINNEASKKDNSGRYFHEIPVLAELKQQQRGNIITLRKATDFIRGMIDKILSTKMGSTELTEHQLRDLLVQYSLFVDSNQNEGIEVFSNEKDFNTAVNKLDKSTTLFIKDSVILNAPNYKTITEIQGREAETVVIQLTATDVATMRTAVSLLPSVTNTDVVARYLKNLLSSVGRSTKKVIILTPTNGAINFVNSGNPVLKFESNSEQTQATLKHSSTLLGSISSATEKAITLDEYKTANNNLIDAEKFANNIKIDDLKHKVSEYADTKVADFNTKNKPVDFKKIDNIVRTVDLVGMKDYSVRYTTDTGKSAYGKITSDKLIYVDSTAYIQIEGVYTELNPIANSKSIPLYVLDSGSTSVSIRALTFNKSDYTLTDKVDVKDKEVIKKITNAKSDTKTLTQILTNNCKL